MKADDARRRIREILGSAESEIIHSDHCRKRMVERGITTPNIHRVLKHGCVMEAPMPNQGRGNWECSVESVADNGRMLRVCVAFWTDEAKLLLVTALFD